MLTRKPGFILAGMLLLVACRGMATPPLEDQQQPTEQPDADVVFRDDLVAQFGLPEGYAVQQLFSPPTANPRLASSQDGTVYLADITQAHLSLLDPRSGDLTVVLEAEDVPFGWIVGGPEDTVLMHVGHEIWQVHPDGSKEVWGEIPPGVAHHKWAYTPDGRLLAPTADTTGVAEIRPDGTAMELASGFAEVYHITAGPDGTVYVNDLPEGTIVAIDEAGNHREVAQVAPDPADIGFSPDGRLFVNNVGTGFAEVNLTTGEIGPRLDAERSACPAIVTPGGFVFSGGSLALFSSFPSSQIHWADLETLEGGVLVSNQGAPSPALAIGPDGWLYGGVSGCGDLIPAQVVRMNDAGTREVVVEGFWGEVMDIAFDPEGGLYISTLNPVDTPLYYLPPGSAQVEEVPGMRDVWLNSLAVDPVTGHVFGGMGEEAVLELIPGQDWVRHPMQFPEPVWVWVLTGGPDGTLYAYAAERERAFTGPQVKRWLVRLDVEQGTSEIVSRVDLEQGCCPMSNLAVAPGGDIWWLLSPDHHLYHVTPEGNTSLFARELFWDSAAIAVDSEGDIYFTNPMGIYRIFRP